ncbi:MAG: ATP-binding protein, partial [Pseudohongiellaceae bacterium]
HIVTHVPASTLAFVSLIPRSLGQWVPLSLLLAAIASIVGVVAWRLAGTVDRLNLQDSQLQSERENLELKVASRTEELEKEKERAELANKAKSSFLATMSHEIRTPMNGVIGLVDVLRLSSLRPKQMEQVGLIRDSAYSLLTIIDDILDFSKIEAGKITLETEPVTLSYLSESVSSAMAVVAQQRGVELTFYRSPKLPLAVVSDAVRLRQIITNLVGNAVKFSSGLDRPGRVSVRLEAPNEAFIQLTVKDNGIGMRRESVESLFKAFTQADASTTRRFGGSGLGLVITKRLVTLMGGTISVESEEGVGTTFTVELPVIVTTMAASPKFSHSLEGTRVYLSGDNAELVTDWLTYLQQAGARDVQSMETARLSDMDKLQAADDKETLIVVLDDKDANLRERYLALSDTLKDRHNSRLFVISRLSDVRVNNVNEYLTILQRDSSHAKSFTDFLATVAGVDLRWDEPGFESVKRVSVSRDDAIASNKLVLVAEDNEINQQVIRNQLDLLGYAYDIAKDGREALEFWYANEHDYALILTDIHMPVLDGYQLTATIRGQEQAEPRIPILALTANATKGEKARCLEMGMNDYFTKPVPLEELESSLAAWSNGRQEAANLADQADPAGTSSSSGIDFSLITRYLGDNREQISLFLAKYAKSIEKSRVMVQSAYNNGDWKEIGNITHTLKSTSRSVGALALGDLCAELEKSCNALDEPAIHEAMRTFQSKIDDVMQAIAAREEETDASG